MIIAGKKAMWAVTGIFSVLVIVVIRAEHAGVTMSGAFPILVEMLITAEKALSAMTYAFSACVIVDIIAKETGTAVTHIFAVFIVMLDSSKQAFSAVSFVSHNVTPLLFCQSERWVRPLFAQKPKLHFDNLRILRLYSITSHVR